MAEIVIIWIPTIKLNTHSNVFPAVESSINAVQRILEKKSIQKAPKKKYFFKVQKKYKIKANIPLFIQICPNSIHSSEKKI